MQPVLDECLPWLSIGSHTNLTLPTSEVISQYLGVGTLLSGYALYSTVNYRQLSFGMNIVFILVAFMIASGHGVHVACVTIQIQMRNEDPLYALIYFLHEHFSHNTFLTGFYCLVFLLIWSERHSALKGAQDSINYDQLLPGLSIQESRRSSDLEQATLASTPKTTAAGDKTDSCHRTSVEECAQGSAVSIATIGNQNHMNGTTLMHHLNYSTCTCASLSVNGILATTQSINCDSKSVGREQPTSAGVKAAAAVKLGKDTTIQGGQMNTLLSRSIVLWTTWVMPVLMGTYFSVFASLTSTKPLTVLFYVGVLCSQMTSHKRLPLIDGLSDLLKIWDREMVVSGFFTKAVLIGLPLLTIDFE